MSKLTPMNLGDRCIELTEQLEAPRRDAGADLATILRAALALDQPRVLEPVEKSRDVRHLRYHSVPDLVSAEAVFAGAAQNAEHVVLRRRYAMLFERISERVAEHGSSTLDIQMRFLLRALEWPTLPDVGSEVRRHIGH